MFAKAIKGGYAIPAFNFNNMEQLQAIISACVEANSPVILQVSAGARKYANQTLLRYMAQGAVEYAKELNGGKGIPITLHVEIMWITWKKISGICGLHWIFWKWRKMRKNSSVR